LKKKKKIIIVFASIFAAVLSLYIIFVIIIHVMSLTPSGAVKVRILKDYHPIIALKSKPYYDEVETSYLRKTMYSISERYESPDNTFPVTMFSVKKHNGKYIAYDEPEPG